MDTGADGRLTIDQRYPVRINVDAEPWAPTSTFGTILTARDQFDLFRTMMDRSDAAAAKQWFHNGERERQRDRDRRITRVARRWHGDPLQPPSSANFVAGDVAAMRTAVAEQMIDLRHRQRVEQAENNPGRELLGGAVEHSTVLDMVAEFWLYNARSYFLGARTLVGLVDSEIPTGEELAELRLPSRDVVVYFGGDLTLPTEITSADDVYAELFERVEHAEPDADGRVEGDRAMPATFPGPLICLHRNQPVQMCGVALHADDNGRLADEVMWLVSCPEHHTPNRYVLYGSLSRSTLRYLAVNLAAAVAWGRWTPPSIDELPDIGDPNFRDVIRSSRFRKQEPHGGALGVHVLDVKRTMQPSTDTKPEGTHASPAAHSRRAHWRRVRVGPRDDWHYERRFISRAIINPDHVDDRVTVYRLPPPP